MKNTLGMQLGLILNTLARERDVPSVLAVAVLSDLRFNFDDREQSKLLLFLENMSFLWRSQPKKQSLL